MLSGCSKCIIAADDTMMIRSYAAGRRMMCRCNLSSTYLHAVNLQLPCHGMRTICRHRNQPLRKRIQKLVGTDPCTTWSALQQLLIKHVGLQLVPAAQCAFQHHGYSPCIWCSDAAAACPCQLQCLHRDVVCTCVHAYFPHGPSSASLPFHHA